MESIISSIKLTQGWIQSEIRVQIHRQGIWDNKVKNPKRLTTKYIQIQEVQIQSRITLKISGIFKNIIETEGKIQSSFKETKQNEKSSNIRINPVRQIHNHKFTIRSGSWGTKESENTNSQIQNEIVFSLSVNWTIIFQQRFLWENHYFLIPFWFVVELQVSYGLGVFIQHENHWFTQ